MAERAGDVQEVPLEIVIADRQLREQLDDRGRDDAVVTRQLTSQPFRVWAEYWAHLAAEEGRDLSKDPVDVQTVELTTLGLQLVWDHEHDVRALDEALHVIDAAYPALGVAARGWLLTPL